MLTVSIIAKIIEDCLIVTICISVIQLEKDTMHITAFQECLLCWENPIVKTDEYKSMFFLEDNHRYK
jgi:hypothetical protein